MNKLPRLGALNKLTNEYVLPSIANKQDEHICPDCSKDLILKKGKFLKEYNSRSSVIAELILNKFLPLKKITAKIATIFKNLLGLFLENLDK